MSAEDGLAVWIREKKPSVATTVALAENKPSRAREVMRAEEKATHDHPRLQVETELHRIMESEE